MMDKNLTIKEIKDLIRFIDERFGFDFSQYAYVSFKIKVEQFFSKNKIIHLESFFEKIEFNESFKDEFYSSIFNYEFELFRDPAVWRTIKEDILKNIKHEVQYRVCIPSCYRGSELLSFLILRHELNLTDKIEVIYTSKVDHINQVLRGFDFEERKHNLNLSNYKRIEGKELPDHYFVKQANKLVPDAKLFVNTKHMMHNEINEAMLKKSNLIIYRNRLLNFNRTLQVEVVNNLINSLKTGGYLVLGVKERLVDDANRELFSIFNIKESIYKKKN